MLNTIELINLIKERNKALKELIRTKKQFTTTKELQDLNAYREAQVNYQSYYPKIYTFDVCIELFGVLKDTGIPTIIDANDNGDILLGRIDRDGMVSLSVVHDESHAE